MTGARAFIAAPAGPALTAAEARFFARARPLGFILFARNVRDPAQLRALTDALRTAVGRPAPVLIDQEGGRVARMGPPHWQAWPPPAEEVGAAGAGAPDAMRARYRAIGAELSAAGITVNCAPVADLARAHTHPVLANRCYGAEPKAVARIARAVAAGLAEAGVAPVVKHIPGHGAAREDSHLRTPHVDLHREALELADFAPFRSLADLPAAMTAHVIYTAIDPDRPATLSPAVIGLIRDGIGFGGLLISDDISMGALGGPVAARAEAALAAGCDVVLHCNGEMAGMEAIAAACPPLSDISAARAARLVAPVPEVSDG